MQRTAALLAMPSLGLSACSAITGGRSSSGAMTDLAHADAERFRAARPVDHVTVHAMRGDSSVPTARYLLALWRTPDVTPAR